MKKIIVILISFITCLSCQSQEKTDLEKINFSENYKQILENTKFKTDPREIVTTLPIAFTSEIEPFKFGDVVISDAKENTLKKSKIGVLINNTTERNTEGLKIEVEGSSKSEELLPYLKTKYNAPKILSPVPTRNSEGKLLGNSAYLWESKNKSIILAQYYEYTNRQPTVASVLYFVDNTFLLPETQGKLVTHIVKTFSK